MLTFYIWFSLVVGLIMGVIFAIDCFHKLEESRRLVDKINAAMLRQSTQEGHLQKEVYGDRVVYYEKDWEGEAEKKGYDWLHEMNHNHPYVLFLIASVACVIYSAIVWPKEFWDYLSSLARVIRRRKT